LSSECKLLHNRCRSHFLAKLACSMQWTPHYLKPPADTFDGETLLGQWKASEASGRVFWELRRVVDTLGLRTKLCKLVSTQGHLWKEALEAAGFAWDSHVKASRHAAQASASATDALVRDEYGITTEALLMILLFWTGFQRDPGPPRAVLRTFLRRALPEAQPAQLCFRSIPESCFSMCRAGVVEGSPYCSHCRQYLAACTGHASMHWHAESLLQLFVFSGGCSALARWLGCLVAQFAALVVAHLDMFTTTDALKASHLQGPSKKRRIDEDFKQVVSENVLKEKRATSSAAFLRAAGEIHDSSGRQWDEKMLARYQGDCWASMASSECVVLAQDASRLGEPAEETLMQAAFSPGVAIGCWFPPQAISKNSNNLDPIVTHTHPRVNGMLAYRIGGAAQLLTDVVPCATRPQQRGECHHVLCMRTPQAICKLAEIGASCSKLAEIGGNWRWADCLKTIQRVQTSGSWRKLAEIGVGRLKLALVC
jgi:hypothetical protein